MIGVFDAEEEGAGGGSGKEVVEEGSAEGAEVKVAGWGGGETSSGRVRGGGGGPGGTPSFGGKWCPGKGWWSSECSEEEGRH